MIETIQRKVCDMCKKEVEDFAGSLSLDYSDCDYTGCGYPAGLKLEDLCIDCCRKLDKAIMKIVKEVE
jgi:hypothetical protein